MCQYSRSDSRSIASLVKGGEIWLTTQGKSDLETRLTVAAKRQGRRVVDEPEPDKGYYYRSDQLNFARIGVPALYFKAGVEVRGKPVGWGRAARELWTATQYHQPSDEIDASWDLTGAVEDAALGFWVGAAAAEAVEMPSWRREDEFEARRVEALRAAAE